jgi:hypothetical protein
MITLYKQTYEGEISTNRFGKWADCSPGLYLDTDKIEEIIKQFIGQRVRLTIETLPKVENTDEE